MGRNGKFNSDDHLSTTVGKERREKNGVTLIINKTVWIAVLGCNLKNDSMYSAHLQGKPVNITVIQVYFPTTDAEEADVDHFSENLEDLL